MTDNPNGPRSGLPTAGVMDSLRAILQGIHEYILVRCELAGIESKAVFRKLAKSLLLFVVALICLVTGFLYLSLSLVYVLAEVVGWGWGWALLIAGVVLLIIMAGALFAARSFLLGKWFPITISELKKDSAWLSRKTTPTV